MYLEFNGIIYVQSTSLTNLIGCWVLQMLRDQTLRFLLRWTFHSQLKKWFQMLLQLNLTVFLPLSYKLLQLTWKLLHLQPRGIKWPHEYYGSCSVQGRKGSLNPLQKQPVSQYWNFPMVSDWISVKGTFTAFSGTVQVGLVKASLSFSDFNIASKQHGRSKEKKPSGKYLTMIIFYLFFQFLCTIPNFPTGEAGHQ